MKERLLTIGGWTLLVLVVVGVLITTIYGDTKRQGFNEWTRSCLKASGFVTIMHEGYATTTYGCRDDMGTEVTPRFER